MSLVQQLLTIAFAASANFLTRVVPFRLFQRGNQTPRYIQGLGEFLPGAIMVMLVVYCLRNVTWLAGFDCLHDYDFSPPEVAVLVCFNDYRHHRLHSNGQLCLLDDKVGGK
jgi:hypothetical protein